MIREPKEKKANYDDLADVPRHRNSRYKGPEAGQLDLVEQQEELGVGLQNAREEGQQMGMQSLAGPSWTIVRGLDLY